MPRMIAFIAGASSSIALQPKYGSGVLAIRDRAAVGAERQSNRGSRIV